MNEKPWLTEGDEHYFEAHGLKCFMGRSAVTGTWCGYVALPLVAQARSKIMDDSDMPEIDVYNFDVHGGVTFNGYLKQLNGFALGFDTAHHMDRTPAIEELLAQAGRPRELDRVGTYRTKEYVINETTNLARQLVEHYAKENSNEHE